MKRISPFIGVAWAARITDEATRHAIMALSEWAEHVKIEVEETMIERLKPQTLSIGSIAETYDDGGGTQTETSPVYRAEEWEDTVWEFQITKANAPTDISFQLQTSSDGSTWHDAQEADASVTVVAASIPADISMTFRHAGGLFRVQATATGVSAVNTITVADGGSYRAPRQ